MNKDERQALCAERWRLSSQYGATKNGQGCIWAVTGFGKTRLALCNIVSQMVTKKPDTTIVILFHRIKLEEQWKTQIANLGLSKYRILATTVQYLIDNQITLNCDLLIVDELHKFYADEFIKYINGEKIKFKFNLGLTATYKDPKRRFEQIEHLYPVIDTITKEEAIKNGWISKYIEYNLPVYLTEEETEQYTKATNSFNAAMQMFNSDFGLVMKIINGDKLNKGYFYAEQYASQQGYSTSAPPEVRSKWSPDKIFGYATTAATCYTKRMNILNQCKSKYETTLAVIDKFKLKTMVFSESTKFADNFGELANEKFGNGTCVVYHSQLESRPLPDGKGGYITYKSGANAGKAKLFGIKTLRDLYLGMFQRNEATILSTARTLDEGYDLEDIRIGIVTSRSNNFNQQDQRTGRIIRIIPNSPNDVMLIVNLYVPDTPDERKLENAQRSAAFLPVNIESVDQITFDEIDDEVTL